MTDTIVEQQHKGRIGFGEGTVNTPISAKPAVLLEANSRRHRRNEARAAPDRLLTGKSPEIYDRFVVPLFFETYAHDLAVRLTKVAPQNVLETAAGTGALTRAIASRLPTQARIVATDLNQAMLDHGAARQERDSRVTWQQADALALPYLPEIFDAVACQFGVMFFPDKVQGYREARRVLKPGGHFFFNVWARIAENELVAVIAKALASLFPQDPPNFLARTRHGYSDVRQIREDLSRAGFTSISIETRDDVSRPSSARDIAFAFCQGTPLRNEIQARDPPPRIDEVTQYVADALAQRFGSGAIAGRTRALVVTAIR
jgi:ubiquinone/menaquinone biosynthesis C-methylase UbiE